MVDEREKNEGQMVAIDRLSRLLNEKKKEENCCLSLLDFLLFCIIIDRLILIFKPCSDMVMPTIAGSFSASIVVTWCPVWFTRIL
jgi:hypothetical protein